MRYALFLIKEARRPRRHVRTIDNRPQIVILLVPGLLPTTAYTHTGINWNLEIHIQFILLAQRTTDVGHVPRRPAQAPSRRPGGRRVPRHNLIPYTVPQISTSDRTRFRSHKTHAQLLFFPHHVAFFRRTHARARAPRAPGQTRRGSNS